MDELGLLVAVNILSRSGERERKRESEGTKNKKSVWFE